MTLNISWSRKIEPVDLMTLREGDLFTIPGSQDLYMVMRKTSKFDCSASDWLCANLSGHYITVYHTATKVEPRIADMQVST